METIIRINKEPPPNPNDAVTVEVKRLLKNKIQNSKIVRSGTLNIRSVSKSTIILGQYIRHLKGTLQYFVFFLIPDMQLYSVNIFIGFN